jgi:hypothetical protein
MLTPQLLAAALRAAANALDGNNAAPGTAGTLQVAPAAQPDPLGLGAAPPAVTAPANVTEAMVTDLIQPHVGNDAVKQALGTAMRALGINALTEAQPQHYPQLYMAFKDVLARFGIGATPPQAPPASII